MTPHVARCAEAVQHDHCRAMTADPHMDGCTVGFDRPRLHHSREGINPIYVRMLVHLVYSRFVSSWWDGRLAARRRTARLVDRDVGGPEGKEQTGRLLSRKVEGSGMMSPRIRFSRMSGKLGLSWPSSLRIPSRAVWKTAKW